LKWLTRWAPEINETARRSWPRVNAGWLLVRGMKRVVAIAATCFLVRRCALFLSRFATTAPPVSAAFRLMSLRYKANGI
jgi:hypothetical protein